MKRMKKMFVSLMLLTMLGCLSTAAQSLVFHLAGGAKSTVSLPATFTVTPTGDKLVIDGGGSVVELAKDDVMCVTYRGKKGDVNEDETVDVADIATIIDIMAGQGEEECCLWIPGNGNGWNHDVAPVLVSKDGKVFSGYAYMNGEFKFTPFADWSAEYNNSNFTTVSSNIDCGDGNGGEINFTGEAGMYFFTVDISNKTIDAVPVTWSVIGGFNSWGSDEVMTYDEDYHCLSVDVNFDTATEWKFRRDYDWSVNYGGTLEALKRDGANLTSTAGAYTIQLFIERLAQDGMHAAIKQSTALHPQ